MCFFYQFPTIFCTFVQILRVFLCTLAQFCALPASSFSVLLYKLFLHIARNCTCEAHSFFWHICTNFFQLAAALFPACEKLCSNLVSSFLARFHSFPQLLQLFPSAMFMFLQCFSSVLLMFLQCFSLVLFMLLQCFSFTTFISP